MKPIHTAGYTFLVHYMQNIWKPDNALLFPRRFFNKL